MSKLGLNREDWKLVGHFGGAGLCWIGDPCYILHKDKPAYSGAAPEGLPESLGKDWGDFCDKLDHEHGPLLQSFPYAMGHEGLGICVSTGYGDGYYPVYAHISDEGTWGKRVAAIFIDFLGIMEDDEDKSLDLCSECHEALDENGNCTNVDCQKCIDEDNEDEEDDEVPDSEDLCVECEKPVSNGVCVNPICINNPNYGHDEDDYYEDDDEDENEEDEEDTL